MTRHVAAIGAISLSLAAVLPACLAETGMPDDDTIEASQPGGEDVAEVSQAASHCWVSGDYFSHSFSWCIANCNNGVVAAVGGSDIIAYGSCGMAVSDYCWNNYKTGGWACWGYSG